jgi:hypothetical protein
MIGDPYADHVTVIPAEYLSDGGPPSCLAHRGATRLRQRGQPARLPARILFAYFGTGKVTTLRLPSPSTALTPKRKLSLVIPFTV